MDSNTFMGYLITAIIALLSGASVIVAIVIRPIIKLNAKITELSDSLKNLNGLLTKAEQRIEKHGNEIDTINKDLRIYEGRISRLEGNKLNSPGQW